MAANKEIHMAKKGLLVLVLAAVVAGGAFAQMPPLEFSAGGGFAFSGGRIGRIMYDTDNWGGERALGFGGFLFFDATFVEASVSIMGGPLSWVDVSDGDRETYNWGSLLSMELALLGKFPFALGESATFFPLLGIGGNIALSVSDEDGYSWSDFTDEPLGDWYSTFRLKFGVGADFAITERVFFRAQGLGWYGFAPSGLRDMANEMNDEDSGWSARGGFGASVRLAVGFRF